MLCGKGSIEKNTINQLIFKYFVTFAKFQSYFQKYDR